MPEGHTQRLESALAGRYKVQKKLGEGGMATVYLAEDLKHERKVALKILKPELAAVIGAERFLTEIKTTANLQHPHILPLFDSGEADGFLYYVMPFIDGETLAEKLARERQMGVDEAVRIARDVADALDYAHRNDVLHRDIKPANILLHDGRPVVADFGIAVAISAAGGGRMTETGLSLGTPHYMSPEQASADRDLNARSDVYSLGCVLYEMLAGQPPHTGPSAQSILVRILTEDPRNVAELRRTVPANIAAAVMKSIEKLPADRFDSAKEFVEALDDVAFTHTTATPVPAGSTAGVRAPTTRESAGRTGAPRWFVALFGGLMLAAGYGASMALRSAPPPQPSVRFALTGDSTHTLRSPCCGRAVAVSPDGSRVVYQGISDANGLRLYQRPLNQQDALPIPGTEDARHPFFSPDGEWLGFFSGASLLKVRFDGGTPMTVTSGLGMNQGAAWSREGVIVYALQDGVGLFRVSADGGDPEQITTPDSATGERIHRWPHIMPDGKNLVFAISMAGDGGLPSYEMLATTTIDGGEHRVIERGADPRYVESGFLTYADGAGSIMAQSFDADRMELSASRFRIAEGTSWRGGGAALTEYDISRNGTLIFRHGGAVTGGINRLVLVDMDGSTEVLATLGPIRSPSFSPDGRFIAYEQESGDSGILDDVWVWDIDRSNPMRVTFENDNSSPAWDRNGDRVFFETATTISARAADGSGETEVIFESPGNKPIQVSPDGAWLVWTQADQASVDIWIGPTDGSAEPRPLLETTFDEFMPAVSPDGRWIAYVSDESGLDEIYVEPFPDRGRKFKVTTGGAIAPIWAPDGRRLYYRQEGSIDRPLTSVEVQAGERFTVGVHQELFSTGNFRRSSNANYDISPDGTRFVFVAVENRVGSARVGDTHIVITNALNPGLGGN